MTKSKLIKLFSKKNPQWSIKDIEKAVDVIIGALANTLVEGRRVEFRGFGVFFCRHRKAQVARNLRTKELVNVPSRRLPVFRPSKEILGRLNGEAQG